MQQLLHNFIEATSKVNQTLAYLVEIGLEKQQLIIFNQVQALDTLIRKEGILVNNLTRLETARYKLQETLASYFKLMPEDLSASVLLTKVQSEYEEFYEELEKELNELSYQLTRLKAINNHNNELIEQSLDYIDVMQSLLEGDVAGTYSAQGEQTEDPPRPRVSLLDKKV